MGPSAGRGDRLCRLDLTDTASPYRSPENSLSHAWSSPYQTMNSTVSSIGSGFVIPLAPFGLTVPFWFRTEAGRKDS
jgi:hypothetical protein